MKVDSPDSFEKFSDPFSSGESLRNRSVRGAFYMATVGGIEFAIRLSATLILVRILAPEDFGLVAMVLAFTGLADIFKDLGLGTATIQRKSISHHQISSLFWINVICGVLVMLAFCAMSPGFSWFYGETRLLAITCVLASTILLGGMTVQHEALLLRQMAQGSLANIRLAATFLSSCLAIALAVDGLSYWALIVREVARSFIYLLGVWWSCRWLPALLMHINDVRGFLNFGRDMTLTNVVFAVVARIDGVLVGKFFGADALGIYRQAENLVSTPIERFNEPLFSISQSGLSSIQSDPDRYRRYYQRVVGFIALVTVPLGVFVAIYSYDVTRLALGEKWLAATPFVSAFGVAAALKPTIASTAIVALTLGRSKVLLGLGLLHSLVLIVFLMVGLYWGALGIALAHIGATVCMIPLRLYYGFRGSPISVRTLLFAIKIQLGASAFMAASLVIFRASFSIEDYFYDLLAGCAIGAATYSLPFVLLPCGRVELRRMLQDVRGSLLSKETATGLSP
jgi:PST family polysaccharide transporter